MNSFTSQAHPRHRVHWQDHSPKQGLLCCSYQYVWPHPKYPRENQAEEVAVALQSVPSALSHNPCNAHAEPRGFGSAQRPAGSWAAHTMLPQRQGEASLGFSPQPTQCSSTCSYHKYVETESCFSCYAWGKGENSGSGRIHPSSSLFRTQAAHRSLQSAFCVKALPTSPYHVQLYDSSP